MRHLDALVIYGVSYLIMTLWGRFRKPDKTRAQRLRQAEEDARRWAAQALEDEKVVWPPMPEPGGASQKRPDTPGIRGGD